MTRHILPPLAAIRAFEAAARHRNFTKAASELGMTQAAVSYQIKLLEERVGAPLFVRAARGVALTEVGAAFAARAGEALDILADAFSDARGSAQGSLTVSVVPTFATNALASRLGRFQAANPSLAVHVSIGDENIDFEVDSFDVAIRGGKGAWPGLSCNLIFPSTFSPMLSPALAQSIGGVKQPADLLKLPLIAGNDPWWDIWLGAAGIAARDRVDPPPRQSGPQVLNANAAIAGQGVAMLTPEFCRDALSSGQLLQPFDLVCSDGEGYWLVYPEKRRNLGKVRAFRNWIEAEFASVRQESETRIAGTASHKTT